MHPALLTSEAADIRRGSGTAVAAANLVEAFALNGVQLAVFRGGEHPLGHGVARARFNRTAWCDASMYDAALGIGGDGQAMAARGGLPFVALPKALYSRVMAHEGGVTRMLLRGHAALERRSAVAAALVVAPSRFAAGVVHDGLRRAVVAHRGDPRAVRRGAMAVGSTRGRARGQAGPRRRPPVCAQAGCRRRRRVARGPSGPSPCGARHRRRRARGRVAASRCGRRRRGAHPRPRRPRTRARHVRARRCPGVGERARDVRVLRRRGPGLRAAAGGGRGSRRRRALRGRRRRAGRASATSPRWPAPSPRPWTRRWRRPRPPQTPG